MRILCIGSSSIDLFANPESEQTDEKSVTYTLGDKIPVDIISISLGGNAANVAAGLKRLGHNSALYTYIGNDMLSRHIEQTLESEGVDVIAERIETATSSLSFILRFPNDRIIFSHHNKNEHGFDPSKLSSPPDFIFLSSVGENWQETYKKVLSYVSSHAIPLAFSPGSRQLKDMDDVFFQTLSQTTVLTCNLSEAQEILKEKDINSVSPEQAIKELQGLGIKTCSITDGGNGAYANEAEQIYSIESIPTESHERTGAGDAYAAGFLAAYASGQGVETAMQWGSVTAHHVMRKTGAQKGLASDDEVTRYLSEHSLSVQEL